MRNADKTAYPLPRPIDETQPYTGLTKREYFASMAMQKLVDFGSWDIKEEVIKRSIDFADELLKQLES